jgi:hypothetical protein
MPASDQNVTNTVHDSDSLVVKLGSFNRSVEGVKGTSRIRTEIKQGNLRPVEKTTVLEANAGSQDRSSPPSIEAEHDRLHPQAVTICCVRVGADLSWAATNECCGHRTTFHCCVVPTKNGPQHEGAQKSRRRSSVSVKHLRALLHTFEELTSAILLSCLPCGPSHQWLFVPAGCLPMRNPRP